uniref:P0 protein n=1 Tax=Faba bean polerovirus 1 TaxID=2283388 RepID=A0A455KZJ9_9VIRU|nr:P0 protein [Faba bean polerovirus 1]
MSLDVVTIDRRTSQVLFNDSLFNYSLFLRRSILIATIQSFNYLCETSSSIHGTNKAISMLSFLFQLPFIYGGFELRGGALVLPHSRKSKKRRTFNKLLADNGLYALKLGDRRTPTSTNIQITAGGSYLYKYIQNPLAENIRGHADVFEFGKNHFKRLLNAWCLHLSRRNFELYPIFSLGDNLAMVLDSLADNLVGFAGINQQYHASGFLRIARDLHGLYGETAASTVWQLFGLDRCPCVEDTPFPNIILLQERIESEEGEDGEGFWEL